MTAENDGARGCLFGIALVRFSAKRAIRLALLGAALAFTASGAMAETLEARRHLDLYDPG